ncbi:hypothetical protein SAMN05421847_2775 [Halpernia humi]|uniref:Uncharacterized protein n=1 Tax=Halpernia humi TaxID=493375 RepID=A0A1H6B8C3_9FLAO|nr:hypothetical protein SAMN05421847_2775 [Halpernia humi]
MENKIKITRPMALIILLSPFAIMYFYGKIFYNQNFTKMENTQ